MNLIRFQEFRHLDYVLTPDCGKLSCFFQPKMSHCELVGMINSFSQHACISTAASVSDTILFQKHNLDGRIELIQEQRCPETGESAANDANVSSQITGQ